MKAAMQQKFGGECVALTEVPSWTQNFKQCVPWRSDCYSLIAFVRKTTSPFGADVIYLSHGRPLSVVPCIIPIRAVFDNAYCLSMVKSGICSLEWLVMIGSDAIGERFLPTTARRGNAVWKAKANKRNSGGLCTHVHRTTRLIFNAWAAPGLLSCHAIPFIE